jgi:hypothetical protein
MPGVADVGMSLDAMKNVTLHAFLLLVAFAGAPSRAGELQLLPDFLEGGGLVTEPKTAAPLALHLNLFGDFRSRLESAIDSGNPLTIQALYRTNGVVAEEMKLELARWRRTLGKDAQARASLYYKELSTLPLQAYEFWSAQAHRLTTHKVTHLAFVQFGTDVRLMIPLVVVEDRLLIVPSDKIKSELRIEPGGPAKGKRSICSEPNRTPSEAGTRR